MAWTYLIAAGLVEIIGVIGIKKVSENNNFFNNILLIGGFFTSFTLLTYALQHIQLSTAYAVWTGIGTVGSTIIGILFFNESKNAKRIFCVVGIVATITALRFIN